jgi:tetratricopeptide (TPR) repeat protein
MRSFCRLFLVGLAFSCLFVGTAVARDAATWNENGLLYSAQNNYNDAIDSFNRAIEQDPQFIEAYNNRGFAYFKLNNYQEAIKDYNKAIELNPKYTAAYNNRSLAYRRIEDYQQALKDANKAIELDPKLALSYYNRGIANRKLDKYEQAVINFKKAIELNMQYALAHNDLAWLYATAKNKKFRDGKLAIEYAERALELNKGNAGYTTDTLAAAYAEAGRFDDAVDAEEKAITILRTRNVRDDDRLSRFMKRLDLYKEHKAWTE